LKGVISEPAAILTPAVLFLATVIRSAFGFGEALVAVPLLQDWRKVHVRSAVGLVFSTMLGIPLGLMLLRAVAGPVVKGILAAVIIAFSAQSLLSGVHRELKSDKFAWLFGFSAGVLGGAYGMNGPPLVIYGSLRGWSPQHFRATLQGYFLPASLAGLWGYRLAGLWTPAVNRFYLLSLPLVILATFLGRTINRRLDAYRFMRYVHGGLILVGIVLLLQAATGHAGH
jgi:hypothetical protein